MDFDFEEDQLAMKRETVRFAQNELNDDLIRRDKEGIFSRDLWAKCAEFGVLALPFPEEYNGSAADVVTTMLVMEGLGYGCKDSGLIFGMNAQMWSVQMPILEYGTEEQKHRYLRRLCSGEIIGAHGMSEPDSGSDAFSLRTTAIRQGDKYVLNGTKTFVTNAPIADIFIIFASMDLGSSFLGISAFLVEKNSPGLHVSPEIGKMGLKTSPMAEVILDDCVITATNILGKERMGAKIFNSSMAWERSCILASNLGAMERQLENSIEYAKERRQFKQPIAQFQSVANKLVDMKVRLETARFFLYRVAWAMQQGRDVTMDAAIAKLYMSESWVQSCLDAVQIHGGYGYTTEYGIERDLRDSVAGKMYSGTSEIQRNIIARQLGL